MQQSLTQIEDTQKTDFFEVFMFCAFCVTFICIERLKYLKMKTILPWFWNNKVGKAVAICH